jgi:PAS domain-containing protein
MVDLEERPRVSLPWWTWLSFVIPVAFLALSGWMLTVAQNSRRQDAGRALAAGKLKQLERALVQLQRGSIVLWRSPVASDSVQRWRALYRDYRGQVKQIDGSDPAIREVMDNLMRVYAAVGSSEKIRLQLLSNTAPEAEARALETEFRSKLDVALAEVKAAAGKLQTSRTTDDDLPVWIGFAIASAGLALILALVLYLFGRQSARLTDMEVDAAAVLAEAQGLQGRPVDSQCRAGRLSAGRGERRDRGGQRGRADPDGLPGGGAAGPAADHPVPIVERQRRGAGAGRAGGVGGGGDPPPRRGGQSLDASFRRTSADSAPGTLVLLRPAGKGRLETQLRNQRDFLNSVLETADVMLAVLDERGRITSINGALERKTGLTPAQLKGQAFQTAFPLEPIAGKPVRFPALSGLCWVTREEERRRILWHGTDLLGRDGAIKSVVVLGSI